MVESLDVIIQKIESGKVDEGLNEIELLLKRADHQTKYEIAQVYQELGHVQKAKEVIDELLMLYPDEGDLYTFAAELLIDLDQEDEAIEMLNEIKENDPAYLQAQLLLADLYQLQSLDEVAEQKLLNAMKIAPDEPIISYGLGEFYLSRGDYFKSIPHLKKAVHADEVIPDTYLELTLAEAYSATGQFEDAIHYYQIGIKKNMNADALFGYGFTAYQMGDMILAIEQFETLKTLDPDYSSVYAYLAKAYESEERIDEALDTLKAGMSVDQYNESLYIQAAKLSFKKNVEVDGESYLQKVIALNPSNVEAVHTLSAYYKHQNLHEELLDLMNHMKDYGEDDVMYKWYEASALRELDEYEKAEILYKEIAEYYVKDIDFLEEYGQFLLEYGRREKAREIFERLLVLKPERYDIVELLENLLSEE
ncbi:tetratricopeptide repeat protein [Alkalihalobacillus hemicellulosilyticus]|uniref:TPR repeat protein n=1 Tax=Halalkalibacter hemicellulosilyticusJCM 9152 TaxID=1236971 RepID=W4QAJ3_9BACI|nr:tetratricopeptide repeat protein [Halalkalibacter hemicellulosilyticus]GAE29030.1 TPR repeat protein [Halalkalibacter hemicellulosilyticusJCM 9152]